MYEARKLDNVREQIGTKGAEGVGVCKNKAFAPPAPITL
jgi:hypothetical protein